MNDTLKLLKIKFAINLFEWHHFSNNDSDLEKDTSVLIIGDCDENLIKPLSKRLKKVDVIFSENEMLDDIKYIVFDENVTFYDKLTSEINLENVELKYDYVLIPALTNDIVKLFGVSQIDLLIEKIISTFTKDGKIFLAVDNTFSLDVIEGAPIDNNFKSYSYEEIISSKLLLSNKYKQSYFKIYFPLPEYKFPLRIYSESYLPTLDDEDQRTRNLVNLGKYKEYANSYLILFDSKINVNDVDKWSTIYIKYNIDRKKEYAVRTSIVSNKKNERKVIKKALYQEANNHILSLEERSNIVQNDNIIVLKPLKTVNANDSLDGRAYVEYEYIDGELLSYVILDKIKESKDLMVDILNEWMEKIIGKKDGIVNNFNLDCTFSNAIYNNGNVYVIDTEWVDKNQTEVNFLKYRILKYFFKSYSQYLNYISFREFIQPFKFTKSDIDRYEDAENHFQQLVHVDVNELITDKYYDNKPNISKFYDIKFEYERLKSKFDEIPSDDDVITTILGQNNIIRLNDVHIANLEFTVADMEREHKKMEEIIDYYHKRESIIFKILSKIKRILIKLFPNGTFRGKLSRYIYQTLIHPIKMFKLYLSSDGRQFILGDFLLGDAHLDFKYSSLPYCERPLVSIIIPCYNQIKYTYRCLHSIIENTDATKIPYEVIIADDVSTDATKKIDKYIRNVRISRNETNLGFLKNCNAAAKLAKGDYLYFLNNDTEVKPNYLSSLVGLIESDFSIGMVGSKLIFPNGKLQEAGGIIWNDASGANYGRNDNPDKPEYNYIKEVDYISGASIMIRKSLFNDIGGFDERYSPAYCEDSDLAFEVRKRGMKVMFQPLSEIIHYEGVSNGTDTTDENSIKSYQVVNNQKLKEKWQDELLFQYPNKGTLNIFKARERCIDKKTILFIDHYVPTWDKDAGSRTIFAYMKMFLKKGYIVKFLGDNFVLNSPYGEQLQQLGIEVLYGNELRANIFNYLYENRRNFDYIFLNRPHIAINYIDFIKENMHTKIIYYGHDLHYMRLKREYALNKDHTTLSQSKYFKSIEYSIMRKSDVSYYPSEVEVDEIHQNNENIKVKPLQAYVFDKVSLDRRDWEKTSEILFVGGFSHHPNIDAIKWYDDAIYPRIKARGFDIVLNIVGSNPNDFIKSLAQKPNYRLFGYVSDEELNQLYNRCRMVIAPLRYGAGVKGKIVEAMSKGCAIVTTLCGAEGIANAKDFMLIEETAQGFAYAIVKNYSNFDELHKLSYYARKEINKNYTMQSAWDKIKEEFE